MKKLLATICAGAVLGLMASCDDAPGKAKAYNQGINIIPTPVSLTQNEGNFKLNKNTKIYASTPEAKTVAEFFAAKMNTATGYQIATADKETSDGISLVIDGSLDVNDEGYTLDVADSGVRIKAKTPQGLFYGMQSFLQLLPAEIESPSAVKGIAWTAPAVSIKDEPRFGYRGIMLDPCRHFIPVENIKKQLDVLALFKINRMHWHLTDDQGWRIEIKKYPKLTEIGSKRIDGEGTEYGGFYTQEEVKDIVKYAADRFITIVPEIELPGHEMAAIAAYPELSCEGKLGTPRIIWGVEDIVLCAGKEEPFQFFEDVIAEVISSTTGIPVFKLTQAESKKLLNMEAELHKRIIGQDEAVSALSRSIRRTRVGLKDPKRPSGSFIFAGPTGVGKTELAKTLAEFLFDDEDALIRVDMSEFSEKYAASRLFGAPPGYVGYEEGGELTEKVRRKPFSVVLFDEIEKAHPDIFNTLLQVLDDGHLTDGQGRKVDFKNTIIILTTNLGTRDIAKAANTGFNLGANNESSYQRMKDQVSSELKQQFRPEFLNRLDDIIVFKQLTEPQVRQIVDLDVKQLNDRLFDRHMSLELTDAAKDLLAQKGFDPLLGARPLRRVIQRDIEDAISEKILMGDLEDGQRVIVDAEGEGILGEFTFKGEEFEEPAAADKPAEDGAATDGETPADATPATEPAESAPADSGDAPQE